MHSYVIITPARNEALYLPMVIQSVLSQTIQPVKWVIVSDRSTDGTEKIAECASQTNAFIQVLRLEGRATRSFGSKALAFQEGYKIVQKISFDYIGNLDADITFDKNYYLKIIDRMSRNPLLGVSSGVVWEKTDHGFKRITSSLNHAVGAVQFWRKECFEAIGGYRPVSVGGVDSLAELTARMNGWETRSFPELPIYHHKPVDSVGGRKKLQIAYRAGLTEYHIGSYPLFAILKAIRRWKEKPILLSPIARLFGYFRLLFSGTQRDASDELVAYLKNEQLTSIRRLFTGNWDR